MAKVITIHQIASKIKQYKNKKIVVTGGCFDIIHIGHIQLLENAKKEGDILVVLLESDSSIKKRKGIERPIHSQEQRAEILSALTAVDIVVLLPKDMGNSEYDELIETIHPAVIATSENDIHIEHKIRQAKLTGAIVKKVNNYISSVSSTKLLAILSKELE